MKFEENKSFTMDFSDGDRLQGVLIRKNRDYHLTSMSCNIKLSNDITEQKDFEELKKMEKLSGDVEKVAFEVFENDLESIDIAVKHNAGKKIATLKKEITNQTESVKVVQYFNYKLNQKKIIVVLLVTK